MITHWAPPSVPPGDDPPPRSVVGSTPTWDSRGGSPILVVEDDPSILAMIVQVLRGEGYLVVAARNGAEGLAAIAQAQPSLILLDMRMPRMNGWQFAAALRAQGNRAPVLVMTAAENAKTWAEEIGADGYVTKPFDFLALLDSVAKHRRGPLTN